MHPNENATQPTGQPDERQENGQVSLNLGGQLNNTLPAELLIELIRTMEPVDKIHAAFNMPELYMDDNGFNIFTEDAIRQLSYPTHEIVSWEEEHARASLILHAIGNTTVSLEQIGHMLDIYESVCVKRQTNRRVFLDSDFPDNAPNSIRPVDRNKRDAMTPIHTAILARRPNVVTYLIRRGADVYRTISCAGKRIKPFQYALKLSLGVISEELEDIAIELAPSSGAMAFTTDFRLSEELLCALNSGMDRLAMLLIDLFENFEDIDHDSPVLLMNKPWVTWHALSSSFPMPQLLTALMQDPSYRRFVTGPYTMMDGAAQIHNVINSTIVLYWELRLETAEHERAAESVAVLCRSDRHLPTVKELAGVMQRFGYKAGLRCLLRFAMAAGESAIQTRAWLLENTDAADGEALAHAICFRDRATTEHMLRKFRENGRHIDQPLFEGRPDQLLKPYQEGWRETPLTLALMHRNYFAAAYLLQAGADANKIPDEVRIQVGEDRFCYAVDALQDTARFAYLAPQTTPTWTEANFALKYVFDHLAVSAVPTNYAPDSYMYWRLATEAVEAEIDAVLRRQAAIWIG